jgi:spore cortex formation protein SpoVR/YcgB (stage V sporulation)
MDDERILDTIHRLVDDERQERERLREGAISQAQESERLRRLEQTLDQCWDLLRQRRARKDAGENPDGASVRPAPEVEGYRQ